MSNAVAVPFSGVQMIHVNEIGNLPNALRKAEFTIDAEKVGGFVRSIEKEGLLNGFSIAIHEGKYVVVDGGHRKEAIRILNEQGKHDGMVPVTFIDGDVTDVLIKQVVGNYQSRKTANADTVRVMKQVIIEKNLDYSQVAEMFSMSEVTVRKLLSTLKLPKDVFALLENEEIKMVNGISLAGAYGKLLDDDKEEAVENAQDMTNDELNVWLQEALGRADEAKKNGTSDKVEAQFNLTRKFIGIANVETMLDINMEIDALSPESLLLQKIFQIDEENASRRRAEWEAQQEEKKSKAEQRKADRELKKLADEAAKAVDISVE